YYLVGIRAAHRELFDAIPWSTAAVLATTLARARAAGLRTVCLPSWFDVDTPADLERLRAALDATAAGAGETRRLLAAWRA
ncbi:MAG: TIGR04282 family arsenosugar biosynthesis glycosyltransferase, partial [Candidatus Rokuibacteriota bacterium]